MATGVAIAVGRGLGPACYRNWRAQLDGAESSGASEVPFYSDADIRWELNGGLGPYSLRNAMPADPSDPALILVAEFHGPNLRDPMDRTDTANFTGAWLGDEIASLCALAFGVRLMAGGATRHLVKRYAPDRWLITGDRDRPTWFPKRADRRSVLPRALAPRASDGDLLGTLPSLTPARATSLVRAARSYRDGLWIAEAEPELSWLMLVSALEVAAVERQIERTTPLEILRSSKADMVHRLEAVGGTLAEEVASALKRELRATGRFLDFMKEFMPAPPEKRPPQGFQLDWSVKNLRRCLQTVYEHRSCALHEAIPFPPPMCEGPHFSTPDWEAPCETIPGDAHSTTGGVWKTEQLPFPLHTFEHMTRGALLNWWRALGTAAA
jgi:hypothetical protein